MSIYKQGEDEWGAYRLLTPGGIERQCVTCLAWFDLDAMVLVVGPYGVNCLACEELAGAR